MGFFENTFAVFAMLADKDIGGVIDAMRGRDRRWYVARAERERGARGARRGGSRAARPARHADLRHVPRHSRRASGSGSE
jgi:folylpolyglutamate synthase/dihydropteroate synthase